MFTIAHCGFNKNNCKHKSNINIVISVVDVDVWTGIEIITQFNNNNHKMVTTIIK